MARRGALRGLQALRDAVAPPLPPSAAGLAEGEEAVRRSVRGVELRARRLLRNQLAGRYASAFRGQGIEFAELREYAPGDDVRAIDWKATARLRQPFVRRYATWKSANRRCCWSSICRDRRPTASAAAACADCRLSWRASWAWRRRPSNDLVGCVGFGEGVRLTIAPAKGTPHTLRIVQELTTAVPSGGTDIGGALRYASRLMRRRGLVAVISDFIDGQSATSWDAPLKRLAAEQDVLAVGVRDPRESSLPSPRGGGLVSWSSAEGGAALTADERAAAGQRWVLEGSRRALAGRLRASGADVLLAETDGDYLPPSAVLAAPTRTIASARMKRFAVLAGAALALLLGAAAGGQAPPGVEVRIWVEGGGRAGRGPVADRRRSDHRTN